MKSLVSKITIVILFICPISLFAQFIFTGGPLDSKGECKALWASGDTAFMGFNKNLFRTFNGGNSWELLTNGIPANCDPRTIEFSSNTLIVGTNSNSRIYRSTDFGDNFNGGTGSVTSILIPTASTSGPNFSMIGGTTSSPFRYDFAQSDWVNIGASGISHGMSYVGKDTIWECSGGISTGTTRFSTDNGFTWTAVAVEPNTDVGGGVFITTKAQDFLKVGNRILIGSNLNGFAVLYTDDNGATWSASDLGSTTYSDYGKRFIKINHNHLLTVNLGGLWKSTDQGETWNLVQTVGAIYTMVRWKGDHILIGTAGGLLEFDNYGEGNLVKKHGIASSTSNMVTEAGGTILTTTTNGLFRYNPSLGNWSVVSDSVFTFNQTPLGGGSVSIINDTIFVCGGGLFTSGDNGQTFSLRSNSQFSGQKATAIIEYQGRKILGTRDKWPGGGTPKDPKIFYSSDDGKTYTEGSFTNNISYGYGGGSDNFVEGFHKTGNSIIADMQAGFAISTDAGLNWTFYKDVWSISIMAAKGNTIFHYEISGTGQNQWAINVSSDNGQSWTACSLNGLPNSSAPNYQGFFGIWNVGGELYTYNSTDAPKGLYKYDELADSWTLEPNTEVTIDGPLIHLSNVGGSFLGSWPSSGVWSTGVSIGLNDFSLEDFIKIYPNPSYGKITFDIPTQSSTGLSVFDLGGKMIYQTNLKNGTSEIELKQKPGIYLLKLDSKEFSICRKIVLK